jgi:hypothetical protein
MTPSQNKENAHSIILHALLTYLRSMKMADRQDFRRAGAAIEAHLLQFTSLGSSSSPASSRIAESDARNP